MLTYTHGRMPLHEYLRRHAESTPEKTAIVWYGRRISYAILHDLSDRFAQSLRENGLSQGDVVALYLHNCPEFLIAHLGAQKLGAVVSPCNPFSLSTELQKQLLEVGARAIVTGAEGMTSALDARASMRGCLVYGVRRGHWLPDVLDIDVPSCIELPSDTRTEWPAGIIDFAEALRASQVPFERVCDLSLDDIALMAYTSGTCGTPKAAMLSYNDALYKAAATADHSGIRTDDVLLADMPLHHISGMTTSMNAPIYRGATIVLLGRFDPTAALQAIEVLRVTWWHTTAAALRSAMSADDARSFDLSSLRITAATSFGLALTRTLAAEWSEFASNCNVFEIGYGLSETHSSDVLMPIDSVKWGTHGKPIPGVSVRIVDPEDGVDCPPNTPGEIWLRGPMAFKGYWASPDTTRAVVADGWLRTGDVGSLDDEGYLSFIGRRKELIKVWGCNVSPEEVEAILTSNPNVLRAAVAGIPDADRGEVVHAHVVLTPAAAQRADGCGLLRTVNLEREIIAWCSRHMSHFKVPQRIFFRGELPTTSSGKLLRRLLCEPDAASSLHSSERSSSHWRRYLDGLEDPHQPFLPPRPAGWNVSRSGPG